MTAPPLTPRQAAFVAAYARHGVAERAAIEAGYSERTARGSSARLLANAGIRTALADLAADAHTAAVADAQEVRAWWTKVMRDDEGEMRDRLKASELLARAAGEFVQSVETVTSIVVSRPLVTI